MTSQPAWMTPVACLVQISGVAHLEVWGAGALNCTRVSHAVSLTAGEEGTLRCGKVAGRYPPAEV